MTNSHKTTSKNQPFDIIKDGKVSIVIWRNEFENGIFYNAVPRITYTDEKGNFLNSDNFKANDLLKLQYLIPQAYAKIRGFQELDKQGSQVVRKVAG